MIKNLIHLSALMACCFGGFKGCSSEKKPDEECTQLQSYTLVEKPSKLIVGIECRTSNASSEDIGALWEKFLREETSQKISHKVSDEVIALYCDYESDSSQKYSLIIGCEVDALENLPDGMVAKTIPASSYAVFNALGAHPESVIKTWKEIWNTPLERSYTGDFEVYGEKFLSKDSQEVAIYIGVNP